MIYLAQLNPCRLRLSSTLETDIAKASNNLLSAFEQTSKSASNQTFINVTESYRLAAIGGTRPTVLMVFLFSYMMAVIAFSFAVSSCFNGGQ